MQSITYLLPLLAALSPALAAPSKIAARQASTCAQYTPVTSGAYSVQNDAWGSGSGTGSQCAQIDGLKGNTLSWSTSFTWQGGANQVKTYANAEAAGQTPCKALNSYSTIPTTWDWTYSAPITGDVAYDAFLGPTCDGPGDPHTYEVMIWLAALGGQNPIGTAGATATIAGSSWTLWTGPNTSTGATVYSFVANDQIGSFDADLMEFFGYLVKNRGVDAGLLLTSVQAGTEVAGGKGVTFTTSAFEIAST